MRHLRPEVGQRLVLKNGHEGEILMILRAADALRHKTEVELLVLGPVMQAELGADWMSHYYEASVQLDNARFVTVTPRDVRSVHDPD
jgi:hypothetical protein